MASDLITPRMRVHAWNIHLLAGPDRELFGGLYVPPENETLRFRDIVDHLRLCFELPQNAGASRDETIDPWAGIAFGHAGFLNFSPPPIPPDVPTITMYRDRQLDEILHGLSPNEESSYPVQPPVVRLHVVRHTKCHISIVEPLEAHLKAGCATYLPYPSLRRDERYLPCNNGSMEPAFMRSTRNLELLEKRCSSGSESPAEDIQSEPKDADDIDEVEIFSTPPTTDISASTAYKTMAGFLASCFVASTKCAVTGKGRSWCVTPAIGPALHACHIVPPQHYHVYPIPRVVDSKSKYNTPHLREAWSRTWSANNGILLLSHLRELFDARLFSIHPETLRIRVFVPYDVILEYHDKVAKLPPNIDRKALRHHFEMCCIENMTAEMVLTEHQPAYKSRKDVKA